MTGEEAKRAYMRKYNKKYRNKEKANKYNKEWRRKNPDKVKEYQRRYWERKAQLMSESITNLERIRKMPAAKLAKIIACPYEDERDIVLNQCPQYRDCVKCITAWLESEEEQ